MNGESKPITASFDERKGAQVSSTICVVSFGLCFVCFNSKIVVTLGKVPRDAER